MHFGFLNLTLSPFFIVKFSNITAEIQDRIPVLTKSSAARQQRGDSSVNK